MDKLETVRIFRSRIQDAMLKAELNQGELAKRASLDRSTLSQLISSDNTRLPRADTVAAIARVLQVSTDWLLGLSGENRQTANILSEMLEIRPHESRSSVDEDLARWHKEAAGYKIRYVPATLPDLVKTKSVLHHEFNQHEAKSPGQAIAASQEKLEYSRLPETDMEICMPQQYLKTFLLGGGIWETLDVQQRRLQIEQMISVCEELYPRLRIYLYDGLAHFSAPYTVFGPKRAAIFLGQMYFAFNTTEHIRVLAQHFDNLVKVANVHAHDTARYLQSLLDDLDAADSDTDSFEIKDKL